MFLEYTLTSGDNLIFRKHKMGNIVVNEEKCKACYLCIDACPKKAIEKGDKLNSRGLYPVRFNEEKGCIGCAICAITCPDLAIEKVYK